MSVIADIDHNRAAVAYVHATAAAYLAGSELPVATLVYSDALTEAARDRLADALADLVAADPRDPAACETAIRATRDAMRALDVAVGLAPGAPPPVVRWLDGLLRALREWRRTR